MLFEDYGTRRFLNCLHFAETFANEQFGLSSLMDYKLPIKEAVKEFRRNIRQHQPECHDTPEDGDFVVMGELGREATSSHIGVWHSGRVWHYLEGGLRADRRDRLINFDLKILHFYRGKQCKPST